MSSKPELIEPKVNPTRWVHIGRRLVSVTSNIAGSWFRSRNFSRASVYSKSRDLDWIMGLLALLLGFALLQSGTGDIRVGIEGSWTSFISTTGWAAILLLIGTARIAALKLNGLWQSSMSAIVRAGAAFVSMIFWGQILYVAVAQDWNDGGAVSILTVVYLVFWLAEGRCVIRAIDDSSSIRRAAALLRTVNGDV